MKLGTENKTKTAIAAGLIVVAAFAIYSAFSGNKDSTPDTAPVSQSAAPSAARKPANAAAKKTAPILIAQSLDPTLRKDLLKTSEDVTYKGEGRDIFQSQPEPIPQPIVPPVKKEPPPPAPPPPIPLKFYGFSGSKTGPKQVFLSKGDDIFIAKEGQIIDRRYRIVKIGPNSIEVEDMLTNNHQTLPLTAS